MPEASITPSTQVETRGASLFSSRRVRELQDAAATKMVEAAAKKANKKKAAVEPAPAAPDASISTPEPVIAAPPPDRAEAKPTPTATSVQPEAPTPPPVDQEQVKRDARATQVRQTSESIKNFRDWAITPGGQLRNVPAPQPRESPEPQFDERDILRYSPDGTILYGRPEDVWGRPATPFEASLLKVGIAIDDIPILEEAQRQYGQPFQEETWEQLRQLALEQGAPAAIQTLLRTLHLDYEGTYDGLRNAIKSRYENRNDPPYPTIEEGPNIRHDEPTPPSEPAGPDRPGLLGRLRRRFTRGGKELRGGAPTTPDVTVTPGPEPAPVATGFPVAPPPPEFRATEPAAAAPSRGGDWGGRLSVVPAPASDPHRWWAGTPPVGTYSYRTGEMQVVTPPLQRADVTTPTAGAELSQQAPFGFRDGDKVQTPEGVLTFKGVNPDGNARLEGPGGQIYSTNQWDRLHNDRLPATPEPAPAPRAFEPVAPPPAPEPFSTIASPAAESPAPSGENKEVDDDPFKLIPTPPPATDS